MAELQKTIFGTSEPTKPSRDEAIDCSDGTVCRHGDVHYDVKGCAHSNEDDRHDANVEVVRDILKDMEKWSCAYYTEEGEWPGGAAYIVHEMSQEWPERVTEWVRNEFEEPDDNGDLVNPHADYMDELAAHICEGIDDCFDPEYNSSEYSCYSGDDCCLCSLEVGECEEQIGIDDHPELKALHDLRELDDVLDDLDRDFCVGRSRRKVKNEETGHYEYVGRETYLAYANSEEHPTFEIYTMLGGQWHYVVSADRMHELVCEFLKDKFYCDGRR